MRLERRLIDTNGDGWTHVAVSDVTSVALDLPVWAQQARKIWVEYDIVQAGAIATLSIRPNGLTTNQTSTAQIQFAGGTSNAFGSSAFIQIASPAEAATVQCSGDVELWLNTGARRRYVARASSFTSTTPRTERQHHYEGFWNDTSTLITSLTVHSDITDSIKIGSRFAVFAEVAPSSALAYLRIP